MYPESVSVERSDREIKGEWIEQNRGSNRKDTIGPKYGQVTLTGIKESNSLQAPLQNIRPNLLPATLGPPALSLSPHPRPWGYQPPEGVVANRQEEHLNTRGSWVVALPHLLLMETPLTLLQHERLEYTQGEL
jgi:hypothetical protein